MSVATGETMMMDYEKTEKSPKNNQEGRENLQDQLDAKREKAAELKAKSLPAVENILDVILNNNKQATTFILPEYQEVVQKASQKAGYTPAEFSIPLWSKPENTMPAMMNPKVQEVMRNPNASEYILSDISNASVLSAYVQQLNISESRKNILLAAVSDIGKTDAQTAGKYLQSVGLPAKDSIPECAAAVSYCTEFADDPSCSVNTASSALSIQGRQEISSPIPGDLVHFDRYEGGKRVGGHVGFFLGYFHGVPMMWSANTSGGAGPQIQAIENGEGGLINPRYFQLEK